MSLRDVTIAWDDETGDKVRVTSRTGSAQRSLGISKKVRELKQDAEWGGSTFGARWGETNLCRTRLGPDEEANIKRLCLSPYVETFNLKVIKRFRTWTKKSLRVFEFRDFCVLRYVYMLPTFDVHFAHGHIRISYKCLISKKEILLYWTLKMVTIYKIQAHWKSGYSVRQLYSSPRFNPRSIHTKD